MIKIHVSHLLLRRFLFSRMAMFVRALYSSGTDRSCDMGAWRVVKVVACGVCVC